MYSHIAQCGTCQPGFWDNAAGGAVGFKSEDCGPGGRTREARGPYVHRKFAQRFIPIPIVCIYICPDRHAEENGYAEAACKIVENTIKQIMMASNLGPEWWQFCASNALFLLNRFPALPPRNLKEAFKGPDASNWRESAQSEFDGLTEKGVVAHDYSVKELIKASDP